MEKRKALIAGGGIGGLTCALCLQGTGWDVRVLEQALEISEVGAGLQISPNGMKVLTRLGLEDAVRQNAYEPEILALRHGLTGKTVFEFSIRPDMQRTYGAPYLQIHRADLIDVLRTALEDRRPGAILTGTRVDGYQQMDQTVSVQTGDVVYEADLLVGADGIHSAIRDQMLGPAAPRFTGNVAWRAVVDRAALGDVEVPPGAVIWAGPGRHAVTYPLRRGDLVNFVGVVERDDWQKESWTEQGSQQDMARDFPGWAPLIQRLIESAGTPYRWALFDRAPLDQWTDDRVALLGDACHPMLPSLAQGACQAIEDAWVLSAHLKSLDIPAALTGYVAARQRRAARVQSAARSNLTLFHAVGLGQAAMFGALGLANVVAPGLLRRKYDWVYRHDVTA